jgi:hypothetical protein
MNLQTSDLEGKTFEEKLEMWAKEVLNYCCPIAEKHNRAFYAFQSTPVEKPRVLLLGLNPAGKGPYTTVGEYKGQCTTWELPEEGMRPEIFVQQNPWYFGGRKYDPKEKWNILEKLEVTISVNHELNKEFFNMVYMNLLYFNSKDFKEFQKHFKDDWKDVFDKCADFTKFLIVEIIKPRRIVCLGAHCFPKFMGKDTKYQNRVKNASLDGIPVYGIEHPSSRLSNEKREIIGKELAKLWLGL